MNWYKLIIWSLFFSLLILEESQAKIIKKRGVMDNFNDGLKVAGQMFGINNAADVANLVAKAFSNNNNNRSKPDLFTIIQKGLQLSQSPSQTSSSSEDQRNQNYDSKENQQEADQESNQSKQFQTKSSTESSVKETGMSNLITSMLRMVGFDASKLGALAINAIIMIASAIGNTIMGTTKSAQNRVPPFGTNKKTDNPEEPEENPENGPEEKYSPNDHQPRSSNDPTTIEWFLQNSSRKMKRILKEATHSNLGDKLTDMISSYESAQGQGGCLKMLVCKSSPFIWGMQKSIRKHIDPDKGKISSNEEDLNDQEEKRLFSVQNFFTHLPSVEEYRKHGEKCEKQYSIYCNTTDLYNN